jgi:hypothetical protein
MRERVGVVRRRYGGEVTEEPAKDLIAVEYRHTTARGVSGPDAPDPQLHSHVVITSAVREDDRIVAVASRPVFRSAGEVGAYYRSALAQELADQGYAIEQATGKDGKYFEIASVPVELRDAFSGRSREVARAADRFRARYGRAPERGELRDLALENRRAKKLTNRADLENVWRETAYVQATRARNGTDWYIARDQLGEEGQDPERITRLAGRMTQSRARTPSVIHREIPGPSWDPSRDPLRLSRLIPHVGKLMRTPVRDVPDRDIGHGR